MGQVSLFSGFGLGWTAEQRQVVVVAEWGRVGGREWIVPSRQFVGS
jgi:hypothetical protein